jgi:predicted small lipoprotein YifL
MASNASGHPEEARGAARLEGRIGLSPTSTITRVAVLLVVLVALAACGKKGAPQPPPGEPNTYPGTYPSE